MSGETVENFFRQSNGGRDNTLVIGGTTETASGANLKTRLVALPIGDVSTAGNVWVVPGVAGTIVSISNVIDAAITGADAGLTFEIDGALVVSGDITITQSGSAIGDVDQSVPVSANAITTGQAIEVIKDGSSTTTSLGTVTFEILLS